MCDINYANIQIELASLVCFYNLVKLGVALCIIIFSDLFWPLSNHILCIFWTKKQFMRINFTRQMVENIVKYLNIFNLDTSKIFLFFYIFSQFLLIFVYKKSSEWCSFHREVLTQKKKCEISHLGFHTNVSFSHFFIFFLSCPESCKSAKKKFF